MLDAMRRYVGMGAAWLGATILSVLIASAAVAGIRDGVVDTPAAIGAPTTSTTAAPATTDPVDPTRPPQTTTTEAAEPTTTTTEATTTTGAEAISTTTTTTTSQPPETTTTTQPPQTTTTAAPSYQSFSVIGGTVTLAVANGEVWVVSAVPNVGFIYEAEKSGPPTVEVEFESNTHKSELSAKVENGELKVETEEEPRDGDND